MPYQFTPEGERLLDEVKQFMDDHIYPSEKVYDEQQAANTRSGNRWQPLQVIEDLKSSPDFGHRPILARAAPVPGRRRMDEARVERLVDLRHQRLGRRRAVLEGGVGLAGEGFDSLADSDFPENNLALFARGTSSSSSELLGKQG